MSFLERFKAYLDKQFRLVPMSKEAAELRDSMLGDLMSRAMDLKQSLKKSFFLLGLCYTKVIF